MNAIAIHDMINHSITHFDKGLLHDIVDDMPAGADVAAGMLNKEAREREDKQHRIVASVKAANAERKVKLSGLLSAYHDSKPYTDGLLLGDAIRDAIDLEKASEAAKSQCIAEEPSAFTQVVGISMPFSEDMLAPFARFNPEFGADEMVGRIMECGNTEHMPVHEAHQAIDKILDDLEHASVDSAILAEQLRTLRGQHEAVKMQVKSYKGRIGELESYSSALAEGQDKLRADASRLHDEHEQLKGLHTNQRDTVEQYQNNLSALMRDNKSQAEELASRYAEVTRLRDELAQAKGQLSQSYVSECNFRQATTINELRDSLVQLREERDRLRGAVNQLENKGELQATRAALQCSEAERGIFLCRLDQAQAEVSRLVNARLHDGETIRQLRDEQALFTRHINTLEKQLSVIEGVNRVPLSLPSEVAVGSDEVVWHHTPDNEPPFQYDGRGEVSRHTEQDQAVIEARDSREIVPGVPNTFIGAEIGIQKKYAESQCKNLTCACHRPPPPDCGNYIHNTTS